MTGARLIVEGCAIAAVDPEGTEIASGHLIAQDGVVVALGEGPAPAAARDGATVIDAAGCLLTPGLVNTHHHLYQSTTRGWAPDEGLFAWLTALYPVWALIDETIEWAAARAGLASLVLSGCTTSSDHHYLYPRGAGDLFGVAVEAARSIGLRFHPARGSMDLGHSKGGLPPDEVTEELGDILAATEDAIDRFHDPSFGSMLRVAVAPCSPFSASGDLMATSAELARAMGVRLHTHLAETLDEGAYCLEHFGMRPLELMAELGWLGDDVWLAHCVHLNADEAGFLAHSGTGAAHCPSSNCRLGAGVAPVRELLDAGARVGLGVDGAASNESGDLNVELRAALLMARARGGAGAMTTREALALATIGGARCLGRADEIGSLEAGKLADLALWRLDDLGHAGIEDPVAALVLGPPRKPDTVIVGGVALVASGHLVTADEETIARDAARAAHRLHLEAGA